MRHNLFQIIIIVMVAFMFLADIATATVDAMSMAQLESLFQQETGRQWQEVDAIQKKDFLRKMKKQEKRKEPLDGKQRQFSKTKNKQYKAGSSPVEQTKKTGSFAVRTSYENRTGLSWEDATEDEQKQFFRQYETESRRQQATEEALKNQKQRRDEDSRRKREAEKAVIKAKKEEQMRKKQTEVDEQRRKKEDSRRKMEELRRKTEAAKQKAKSRAGK
jgi:hypothetical protein